MYIWMMVQTAPRKPEELKKVTFLGDTTQKWDISVKVQLRIINNWKRSKSLTNAFTIVLGHRENARAKTFLGQVIN